MSTATKAKEVLYNGPPCIRGHEMVAPGQRLADDDPLVNAKPGHTLPVPQPDGTLVCVSGYFDEHGLHYLGDTIDPAAETVQRNPDRWQPGPIRPEHVRALSVAVAYNSPREVQRREQAEREARAEQAERAEADATAAEAEAAETAAAAAEARAHADKARARAR